MAAARAKKVARVAKVAKKTLAPKKAAKVAKKTVTKKTAKAVKKLPTKQQAGNRGLKGPFEGGFDSRKGVFAYGLPGNINVIGGEELNFDPCGFLDGKSKLEVYRYRECE